MTLRSFLVVAPAALFSSVALADTTTVDFLAGQHTDVGEVTISDADGVVDITIDTSASGWTMDTTHVYVGLDDPRKSAPGRFPYAHEGLGGATGDTYRIDLAEVGAECGDQLVVAVHAEVEQFLGYEDADVDGFNLALPESVDFVPSMPGGRDSYWEVQVSDATGSLGGAYDGWCVDTDHTMSSGVTYTAEVLSSIDPAADLAGVVEHPENFDEVNYIINQGYTGQTCAAAGRAYTYGDIQRAIWMLIDDQVAAAGLGTWSQACADEIYAEAVADGAGFEPGCDGQVAVLLVPRDATGAVSHQVIVAQVTFIELGLECDPIVQSETAWGEGDRQFRTGWGWMVDHLTAPCDGGDDYLDFIER